ncbi:MAG: VTT domain-containing protein [Desulfuromonadaceae bacterium]|nr:VTT domain-containing protein [Desulfuromonadaceae bacterium]
MSKYKIQIIRITIALGVLAGILGCLYLILHFSGFLNTITSFYDFSNTFVGNIIYVLIYVLLMSSLVLPVISIIIVGKTVFTAPHLILLSSIATLIGGILIYLMGLKIGKKVIMWILENNEEAYIKWENFMTKSKYTIFLAILFPVALDQVIMLLCGSGKMPLKQYIPILIIGKGAGIVTTVYSLQALTLLPIWLSILGIILVGTTMYLTFKYENKIDTFLHRRK